MNEKPDIRLVSEATEQQIKGEIERPVYIQIVHRPDSAPLIKQIEFITPEQLAEIAHVKLRTVYGWIEKAEQNGLKFYRAPGTRGVLFDLRETLDWIKQSSD